MMRPPIFSLAGVEVGEDAGAAQVYEVPSTTAELEPTGMTWPDGVISDPGGRVMVPNTSLPLAPLR